MNRQWIAMLSAAAIGLGGCAVAPERSAPAPTPAPRAESPAAPAPPPAAPGRRAQPAPDATVERGKISWYGRKWEGRRTASGEIYDADALTMAHRSLPFGTRVEVTNPGNARTVVLRVNDRGPYVAGRIADVSLAAARQLGFVDDGVIDGLLRVLDDDA